MEKSEALILILQEMEINNKIRNLVSDYIMAETEIVKMALQKHLGRAPSNYDYHVTKVIRKPGDPLMLVQYKDLPLGYISIKIEYEPEIKANLSYKSIVYGKNTNRETS